MLLSNALRNKFSTLPNTSCFDSTSTDQQSPYAKMLPIRLTLNGSSSGLDITPSIYLRPLAQGSPVLCFALQKHNLSAIRLGASFISQQSSLMFDLSNDRLLVYAVSCEAITRQYVHYSGISAGELKSLMVAIFLVVGIIVLLVLYLLLDCLINQSSRRSPK
jgi:hypothetical protein